MDFAFISRFPFAHTFSIVARDPRSGQMGVAVQSNWFSVGSLVPWAEAGVGVVATQAMVNPNYGPLGLALMRGGLSAPDALKALLSADNEREIRQVALVDVFGRVAVHTGSHCIADAGHDMGEEFSAQANMMANDTVWKVMSAAFRQASGDLAERFLKALEAAQAAGGDIRGQQSAALLIVKPTSSGRAWADHLFDLRVEDHTQPISELRRLVEMQRAYGLMNNGDELLGTGKIEEALAAYSSASRLIPQNIEMPFWHAVSLAEIGRVEEALPIFRKVFRSGENWAVLLRRLPDAGLLHVTPQVMELILQSLDDN